MKKNTYKVRIDDAPPTKVNPAHYPIPFINASDVLPGDTICWSNGGLNDKLQYIEVSDVEESEQGTAIIGSIYSEIGIVYGEARMELYRKVLLVKRETE